MRSSSASTGTPLRTSFPLSPSLPGCVPVLCLFQAQSYMQSGEVVAAVDVLQRGLALAPRHLDLLIGLGQTLKELADLRGAEEAFKRALAVSDR